MHADDLSPASRGLRDQQVRFATCDQQTTRRFAQETGRYRLRHFDPPRPDPAIFPYHDGQPPTDGNCAVYEQYRRGESVEALAQRFSQSRTRICRIINELRTARITGLPLDHIGGEEFARLLSRKQEAEDLGAAAGERFANEDAAVAQRSALVSGRTVRGAPADAGAGDASLSEDELP